jgi:predicted phosphohydrolase
MRIFAISDLHLPGKQNKPMDVFNDLWTNHPQQIKQAWINKVSEDDLVLIPGDISWAMTLEEVSEDLDFIQSLPGEKVILRGNHDYWWSSVSKVRKCLSPEVFALQNDYYPLPDGTAICGTRGWELPSLHKTEHDVKIYNRELQRLRLSLDAAKKEGLIPSVVMLHFPPTDKDGHGTAITSILESYQVSKCVYGHLHGIQSGAWVGNLRGIEYFHVSCDAIGFSPLLVHTVTQ